MKKTTPLTAMLFAASSLAFGSARLQSRSAVEVKKSSPSPEQAGNLKKILADA